MSNAFEAKDVEMKGGKIAFAAEIPAEWCNCCLCGDVMAGPIWSCGEMVHGLCDACHGGMKAAGGAMRCPICRAGAITRNHMLESVVRPLIESCAYEGRGCRARFLGGRAAHVEVCEFRDMSCLLVGCGASFPPGDFAAHMVDGHGIVKHDVFSYRDAGAAICESKHVRGVFAMTCMDGVTMIAVVDIAEREIKLPPTVARLRYSNGVRLAIEIPISCARGTITAIPTWRKLDGAVVVDVMLNEYFGDFREGDVWSVDGGAFHTIGGPIGAKDSKIEMRVSRVDDAERYVVLRSGRDTYRVPFDASVLIERVGRGVPAPAPDVDAMDEKKRALGIIFGMAISGDHDEAVRRIAAMREARDPMYGAVMTIIAASNMTAPRFGGGPDGLTEEEQIAIAIAESMK